MFTFISNTLFSHPQKAYTDVTSLIHELRPTYIFGATDMKQLAMNDSLYHEIKIRNSKHIRQMSLFYNKNQTRRAKRTSKFIMDNKYIDRSICNICNENNTCIVLKPCNHAGMCNRCSSKLFNKAIHKRVNNSLVMTSVFPDPRFSSSSSSIEDDLHQIQLSLELCPWCKIRVNYIEYIYIL